MGKVRRANGEHHVDGVRELFAGVYAPYVSKVIPNLQVLSTFLVDTVSQDECWDSKLNRPRPLPFKYLTRQLCSSCNIIWRPVTYTMKKYFYNPTIKLIKNRKETPGEFFRPEPSLSDRRCQLGGLCWLCSEYVYMLPISKINAVKFKFQCVLREMLHSTAIKLLWDFMPLRLKLLNLILFPASNKQVRQSSLFKINICTIEMVH
jgi:hypothetical protein